MWQLTDKDAKLTKEEVLEFCKRQGQPELPYAAPRLPHHAVADPHSRQPLSQDTTGSMHVAGPVCGRRKTRIRMASSRGRSSADRRGMRNPPTKTSSRLDPLRRHFARPASCEGWLSAAAEGPHPFVLRNTGITCGYASCHAELMVQMCGPCRACCHAELVVRICGAHRARCHAQLVVRMCGALNRVCH
jgi:hypothetical protein